MTAEMTLSILGVLISALVAYHIAVRQGAFARPRINVVFGQKFTSEFKSAGRTPWAIIIGLPSEASGLVVVELPIYLECGAQPIRKLLVQMEYPRGRHAFTHLNLRPAAPFADDEKSHFIDLGDRDAAIHAADLLRPGTTTVARELLAYKPEDLKEAIFQPPDSKACPFFRFVAEEIRVFVSAVNLEEFDQRYWLVAVAADSIDQLREAASFIGGALLLKDGVHVRERRPGKSVLYLPWEAKRAVLLQLPCKYTKNGIRYDRMTDGPRSAGVIDLFPILNSEAPRLQLFDGG